MIQETEGTISIELATELTIAWLSNANTRASADEVPVFLAKMHDAVRALGQPSTSDASDASMPAITPVTTADRHSNSAIPWSHDLHVSDKAIVEHQLDGR